MDDRRTFVKRLAYLTGGAVLLPHVVGCNNKPEPSMPKDLGGTKGKKNEDGVPWTRPENWNAMAFNRERGKKGAIPPSYMDDILGPEGDAKHLGKHLPYFPGIPSGGETDLTVPTGFVALMWGDPAKGHAKHPNAPKTEDNPAGHWYNWIKIRKATTNTAEELTSRYSDWPQTGAGDNGKYVAFGGTDIAADSGKNTVYLAGLPKDAKKGDWIRVWAHCLTHGEYVDFMQIV